MNAADTFSTSVAGHIPPKHPLWSPSLPSPIFSGGSSRTQFRGYGKLATLRGQPTRLSFSSALSPPTGLAGPSSNLKGVYSVETSRDTSFLSFNNWIRRADFGSDEHTAECALAVAALVAKTKSSPSKASVDVLDGIYTAGMVLCGTVLPRFLQDLVVRKKIEFIYCPTNFQLADFMTKPLDEDKFTFFRDSMMSIG